MSTKESKLSEIDLSKVVDMLVESGADLKNILKENGLIKQLTKSLVERALQAEMSEHLGYDKYEHNNHKTNARNGVTYKTLKTEHGPIEIEVPRDRSSEFEPIIVPKRKTILEGLDDKIISLYAKGMSVSDIKIQLEELYGGVEISPSLISRITNEVMEEVTEWQSRPLDCVYPIVFFDCLVVNVRHERQVINKSVYYIYH